MQTRTVVTTFEEELARSGRIVYTNVGTSMLPLLREGRDLMVIERCNPARVRRLQAVLYVRPDIQGEGRYILHRILKVTESGSYWIVGDNCTTGETVAPSQIIGVLTAVRRGKKTISVTSFRYRAYVALWCAPYPLRFLILRFRRFCSRYGKKLLRRIKRLVRGGRDA